MKSKTLLIGGSGNLGSKIKKSNYFQSLSAPSRNTLDLLNPKRIKNYLKKHKFDLIINCASLARMEQCEKNISLAIDNNILGTFNLVSEILNYEKKYKKKIKLIYISSDAVYPSKKGNYSEHSGLGPYNVYGWTKLSSEFLIKFVPRHIIIRTRFYEKKKISYQYSASDIFTSQIEVNVIPKYIKYLVNENFNGVINIGDKRISDYNLYKKIKTNLKSFKRKDLQKRLNFNIAKDASLNLKKFKKILKKYE